MLKLDRVRTYLKCNWNSIIKFIILFFSFDSCANYEQKCVTEWDYYELVVVANLASQIEVFEGKQALYHCKVPKRLSKNCAVILLV